MSNYYAKLQLIKDFKYYRSRNNLSLRDISIHSDVSASTISRFENSKEIDLINLIKICDFAGLKLKNYFFERANCQYCQDGGCPSCTGSGYYVYLVATSW